MIFFVPSSNDLDPPDTMLVTAEAAGLFGAVVAAAVAAGDESVNVLSPAAAPDSPSPAEAAALLQLLLLRLPE